MLSSFRILEVKKEIFKRIFGIIIPRKTREKGGWERKVFIGNNIDQVPENEIW